MTKLIIKLNNVSLNKDQNLFIFYLLANLFKTFQFKKQDKEIESYVLLNILQNKILIYLKISTVNTRQQILKDENITYKFWISYRS
ncbi:unnamed protein product [Paramecium sonneborni]|uniref:Uncharacterized protein n=1 Tax=Paramecium sonneborni TaxID=65129 RepID=A0A8S1NK82_9CILI|nr:unnamed protein product [Paramecium sonneborni]